MFPPHLQREIEAAHRAERALQPRWPAAIELGLFRQSIWYELPYVFLPAFPELAPGEVRELSLFGRLLANAIFVHDPLADRQSAVRDTAVASLRIVAMTFEAYRALAPRLATDARFWDRLQGYLAAYASACLEELRFASGERPWHELDEALALQLAAGKSAPSRAIVAGLSELAGAEERLAPLVQALDHFNLACQLWDDLKDWRDDLSRRIPTLLIARVVPARPEGELAAAELKRIARELYLGGHAAYVLDRALAAVADAAALGPAAAAPPGSPALPWQLLLAETRRKLEEARRDVERVMQRHRGRRGAAPLPPSADERPEP